MALSIVNNVANLTAQNNLAKTNSTLSKSLERLSTGLKINRGADGPASLVLSEQQRAQISSLETSLDNTNQAVTAVQTGEGALNEINSLLGKARSLALDSANDKQDDASRTANQAEIANLLATINNIATSTQFNNQPFFSKADGTGNTLTFQIGPTSGQTASLSLQPVNTNALGSGASNTIANLSEVDVQNKSNAEDSIKVIDQAISSISNLRATLGAFQANTLETNANNLRASLENTTTAESVIRDTDFANEIANFTRAQVQLQAGQTVLGNANQLPQLVATLLRG